MLKRNKKRTSFTNYNYSPPSSLLKISNKNCAFLPGEGYDSLNHFISTLYDMQSTLVITLPNSLINATM